VDLELIKRLAMSTGSTSLTSFLSKEFDCIKLELAGGWVGWVGEAVGQQAAGSCQLVLLLRIASMQTLCCECMHGNVLRTGPC
jgi:hypothetical protein